MFAQVLRTNNSYRMIQVSNKGAATHSMARKSKYSKIVEAAGGLLWLEQNEDKKVAIVHRTRYGPEWTLPKGKLYASETWIKAAKREVHEETGYRLKDFKITTFAGGTVYPTENEIKIVLFWNMTLQPGSKPGKTDPEVDEVKWVTANEAQKLLTHPNLWDLLKRQFENGPNQ
jgi:8-oxo-dGTP pyrophosphatase MutT (NUDIX family)